MTVNLRVAWIVLSPDQTYVLRAQGEEAEWIYELIVTERTLDYSIDPLDQRKVPVQPLLERLSNIGYADRHDMPASPGKTGGTITLAKSILYEDTDSDNWSQHT